MRNWEAVINRDALIGAEYGVPEHVYDSVYFEAQVNIMSPFKTNSSLFGTSDHLSHENKASASLAW